MYTFVLFKIKRKINNTLTRVCKTRLFSSTFKSFPMNLLRAFCGWYLCHVLQFNDNNNDDEDCRICVAVVVNKAGGGGGFCGITRRFGVFRHHSFGLLNLRDVSLLHIPATDNPNSYTHSMCVHSTTITQRHQKKKM